MMYGKGNRFALSVIISSKNIAGHYLFGQKVNFVSLTALYMS